ncbi:MAG: 3-phosphoshikimate 1-carboxyvinyltransferase [Anaerolineales bacterium]
MLTLPGSKSITNRALVLAALADGVTTLEGALFSDDTRYMTEALRALGFQVQADPAARRITVHGLGGRIPAQNADLFIGNAGTAARFLTAMLCLGQGTYRIDGVPRMRQRPIADLVQALNRIGGQVVAPSGCPPVEIHARGLRGGKVSLPGDTSSQFVSALLMAAPYAAAPLMVEVTGRLNSRPYVDLTLGMMADFGVAVPPVRASVFHVEPGIYRAQGIYPIEPDASAASYFFAIPAITGQGVEVAGIRRNSRQGDIAFLDILERMGCRVSETGRGIRVSAGGSLQGVDVDMRHIPDTAPTLAVIAPFAESPTTISDIASARVKESDRISAVCTELIRLGVRVEEYPDGMKIYPADEIFPATVRTYDDHRIAMAFALIGLRVPGIVIENPGCVAKTFPEYFEVLSAAVGGRG